MQNTQYYNLIKVEGTDIVNPLTQMNPNWDTIDSTLRSNSSRVVSTSTYSKTGTVHTITRNYPQAPVFRFTATADWNAGDTMIINGTGVNAITPAGEPLGEGAFVTGAQVIGIQTATEATIMVYNKYIPTASEVTTTAGDSVQDELDSMGSVITVFEEGAYAPGDTWVLSQDVIDYMDTHKAFLLEAQIYYGATYNTSRTTQLIARGFGRQVTCAMNRNDIQVGVIRIDSTSFEAFGYDEAHTPHIRNLYMIPLGTN